MTARVTVKRPPDTLARKIARATNATTKAERDAALRMIAELIRRPDTPTPEHQAALAELLEAIANGGQVQVAPKGKRGRPTNTESSALFGECLATLRRQFPDEDDQDLKCSLIAAALSLSTTMDEPQKRAAIKQGVYLGDALKVSPLLARSERQLQRIAKAAPERQKKRRSK